jgi:dolichol-phosphate mannosyltransferase
MPSISVVIPVYKAEDCLAELNRRLVAVLESISSDFEIILVEDCGRDRSWAIIKELAHHDARIKGLQFSRNFGQHYGITAGLDYCDGDWVVVMDCDLQDQPEDIPRLYQEARQGFDIVVAVRKERNDPWMKRLSSWAFYQVFSYLTEVPFNSKVGNFRILSRQVVENFRLMREQLRFFVGLVDWLGFSVTTIEVQHRERFAGKSTYTLEKLWRLATNAMLAYSDKPLRLTIRFGFAMSFLAFAAGIYILVRAFLYGFPVVGWPSLFISLYFIGGIIISILGMIGIYLGKSFDEEKKRPLYIVAKTTFSEPHG